MGKAKSVSDALIEVETDRWQCHTCSAPSAEDTSRPGYCKTCAMYWDDCDAGQFDDFDDDICDHDDYDADILTGVATCGMCGARWHQTAEEIAREREAQKHYDEFYADLNQER